MITKTLAAQVDLTTIEVPYTYAFSSVDTCVTFDPNTQSGTSSSNNISTVAYFEDLTCMDGAVVNLQVVGANGCSKSIQIIVESLCDDFSVNLTQIEDYKFQATATAPGCSSVDFTWFFNDGPFNLVEQNDSNFQSTIELEVDTNIRGRIPANSSITVYS